MAQITIRVSDLTHEPIEEDQPAAKLIVSNHPDYKEPITLDVLPDEVESALSRQENEYVLLSYEPDRGDARHVVMLLEEFNSLATVGDMSEVLETARRNQRQEQRRRGGRRGGSTRRGGRQQRSERIDYTSPEHAGEDHPGRISEAEREYVRTHLYEVNERLRREGQRTIDPADPEMARRYGLEQEPIEEAEIVEEQA